MTPDQTAMTRAVQAALTEAGATLPPDRIAAIVTAAEAPTQDPDALPIGDDHSIAAKLARAVGATYTTTF